MAEWLCLRAGVWKRVPRRLCLAVAVAVDVTLALALTLAVTVTLALRVTLAVPLTLALAVAGAGASVRGPVRVTLGPVRGPVCAVLQLLMLLMLPLSGPGPVLMAPLPPPGPQAATPGPGAAPAVCAGCCVRAVPSRSRRQQPGSSSLRHMAAVPTAPAATRATATVAWQPQTRARSMRHTPHATTLVRSPRRSRTGASLCGRGSSTPVRHVRGSCRRSRVHRVHRSHRSHRGHRGSRDHRDHRIRHRRNRGWATGRQRPALARPQVLERGVEPAAAGVTGTSRT
jgi:hypothetical protein